MERRHVAIALAVLGGLLTIGLMWPRLVGRSHSRPLLSTVVVTAQPVAAGTLLTEEMLKVAEWPLGQPLAGAVTSLQAAAGRRVLVPLTKGEPVLSQHLQAREVVGALDGNPGIPSGP